MLLAFGAAGALGLLLGLWYRIPALLAASGVTAPVCLFVAPFTGLTPLSVAVITFTLLGVMQVGYLAGLMLSCGYGQIFGRRSKCRGNGLQIALRTAATEFASKARSSQIDQR
jgi:hypothetical protein